MFEFILPNVGCSNCSGPDDPELLAALNAFKANLVLGDGIMAQQVDVKSQFIPVLDGFRVGIHQHFQPIEKLGLVLLYAADAKTLVAPEGR